jgi:hypothetical protein
MDGKRKRSRDSVKGYHTGRGDRRKDAQAPARGDNTLKDPDEWKTGDEPMTGA